MWVNVLHSLLQLVKYWAKQGIAGSVIPLALWIKGNLFPQSKPWEFLILIPTQSPNCMFEVRKVANPF